MKYFFLLLLFLPTVSAVAVTPTSIDFGELERGKVVVREVLVVNTLDTKNEFQVSGVYSDSFSLDAKESKVLEVPLEVVDQEDGKYEDYLRVEEVHDTLVNAVSIPVVYRVRGGTFTDERLNLHGVDVYDPETISFAIVAALGLLGVGIYGWRRKYGKK